MSNWESREEQDLAKINTDFQKKYQQSVYKAGVPAEQVHYFKMDYSKVGMDTTNLSPIEKICMQAVQSSEVVEICDTLINSYDL